MRKFQSLNVGGVIVVIFLIIPLIVIVAPMLFLWAVNTLFEQGGVVAYIPHNFWTYLASLSIIALFRGTSQ